jgi:hypothetical protein
LGSGLVLVIVGATLPAMIVRLKLCGPLLPVELVAVTAITVVPLALGVPVSAPPDESEAHPGNPVAPQVIGVLPLAVNWNEYGVPLVPPGNGLVLVIVGTIPLIVRLKVVGPALPTELVAVIDITVVAIAFGVPVNRPPDDRLAHPGSPVPLHVIGVVPLAAN